MRELVRLAIRTETEPAITATRRKLENEREDLFVKHDFLRGKPASLKRAEAAASKATLVRAERDHEAGDPTDLLLVDEVDRLRMASLEQLRAIFDIGGIGLVLVGMPGLERRLARYAQLYSRAGFVHESRPLGTAEVRSLLAGWRPPGVTLPEDMLADPEGVATIIRVTGGNFRLIDRLLTQVGRILELNGLGMVTREVVEAAREVLVIGTV
jgi:DNA transposition AAA+ family ATPase